MGQCASLYCSPECGWHNGHSLKSTASKPFEHCAHTIRTAAVPSTLVLGPGGRTTRSGDIEGKKEDEEEDAEAESDDKSPATASIDIACSEASESISASVPLSSALCSAMGVRSCALNEAASVAARCAAARI